MSKKIGNEAEDRERVRERDRAGKGEQQHIALYLHKELMNEQQR